METGVIFKKIAKSIIVALVAVLFVPGMITSIAIRVQKFDEPLVFGSENENEKITFAFYKKDAVVSAIREAESCTIFYHLSAIRAARLFNVYCFNGKHFLNSIFRTRIINDAEIVCSIRLKYKYHINGAVVENVNELTDAFGKPREQYLIVHNDGRVNLGSDRFKRIYDGEDFDLFSNMLTEDLEFGDVVDEIEIEDESSVLYEKDPRFDPNL